MSGSASHSPRKGPAASSQLSRFGSMPWTQTDIAASSSLARASAPPAFDTQGKLHRRIWVLEKQLQEAEAGITAAKATSQDLRDRVKELERERQAAEDRARSTEARAQQDRRDMDGEISAQASQYASLAAQLEDVKDSWRREKAERARLEAEVERLQAARLEAGGGVQHPNADGHVAVLPLKSRRGPLRPHDPNVDCAAPTTPTRPRLLSVINATTDSLAPTPRRSPSASIAAHHAHLEEQHQQLRAEYRKLHARYLEDLRHWKEYKLAETARIDAKKQRRAAKKEAKGASDSSADTRNGQNVGGPSAVHGSPTARALEGTRANDYPEGRAEASRPLGHPRSSQTSEEGLYEDDEAVVILPQRRSSQRIKSQSQQTPKVASPVKSRSSVKKELSGPDSTTPTVSSHRARTLAAGRTTPWLGKAQTPSKSSPVTRSKRKARVDYDDEDIFGDEEDDLSQTPNPTVRTPLVRDRGAAAQTSLRASTLRRTVAKSESAAHSGIESGGKRKMIDLDNVSPAEKAAELKRLSKMTSKQRREYYAEYKGAGRYLAPDEVRYGVYEDYEIDPAANEGEKYQFHDVKRQRTARKQMHGGDCECCQGYYQAVGHIPRFNQAPKWNDDDAVADGESSRDATMREHQNQVSRHRETWRKPPTPPGYWEIGFPATQLVQEQNELADLMHRKKEAEIQREAMHKDSKWRKKKGVSGAAAY